MMLLHVHKDKTDEIDLNVIAEQFIIVNGIFLENNFAHVVTQYGMHVPPPPKLKHLPAPMSRIWLLDGSPLLKLTLRNI